MHLRSFLLAAVLSAASALAADPPAAPPPEAKAGGAQHVYSDAEAAQHVGEDASVIGKVVAAGASKQGNVYLNFGDVHPKQTFSAAIMAKDAAKFGDPLRFEGKTVAVSGVIVLYNGKPEIVLASPDQIAIQKTP